MNALKSFVTACLALLLSLPAAAYAEYKAVLSCGMNNEHINILACFESTELKLTNYGSTNVYKIYNIHQAGNQYRDGLHIRLSDSFKITAQNSHQNLVLSIQITDENGKKLYQDAVGKFGVIKVGN